MHNDPHEIAERLAAFAKDQRAEGLMSEFNSSIAQIEFEPVNSSQTFPIIYIVGLPRSGTTFLHQVLARNLRVGYINNLIALFWKNPCIGIAISKLLLEDHGRASIEFLSKHGVSMGVGGPHEFGYFWRDQLPLDDAKSHQLSTRLLESIPPDRLAHVLQCMASEFHMPLLFKNLICGLQAKFLTRVYPKTFFVRIHRDTLEVKQSILQARQDRFGDLNVWWSLKPSQFSENWLKLSAHEQVDCQIAGLESDLKRELKPVKRNVIDVNYSDLCNDAQSIVSLVSERTSCRVNFQEIQPS